jgi:hypothetical protein
LVYQRLPERGAGDWPGFGQESVERVPSCHVDCSMLSAEDALDFSTR